ncbi:hypothetical protein [Streptomyces spinoverrucosus]|uniref:hypothetical protein n=1 Tax=Streptomyces spinoverrucosus TaxID=284043 RepID=UPI001E35E42E|nr:hypothetical protein [Streptomyces spinoverrucosus]
MVRDESALEDDETAAGRGEKERAGGNVLGVAISTRSGTRLGTVTDAIVAVGREPAVAGYEVETAERQRVLLPVAGPVAVSGERVLVPDATAQHSAGDLAGFDTALDHLRSRLQQHPQEG